MNGDVTVNDQHELRAPKEPGGSAELQIVTAFNLAHRLADKLDSVKPAETQ